MRVGIQLYPVDIDQKHRHRVVRVPFTHAPRLTRGTRSTRLAGRLVRTREGLRERYLRWFQGAVTPGGLDSTLNVMELALRGINGSPGGKRVFHARLAAWWVSVRSKTSTCRKNVADNPCNLFVNTWFLLELEMNGCLLKYDGIPTTQGALGLEIGNFTSGGL